MSWREKHHFGHEVVADLNELLRVEPEWSADEYDGFTWWPGAFAQTVWTDLGLFQNGGMVYRIHAATEVLRGRGQAHRFANALETAMDSCTLSTVVYDARTDTYRLHCSASVSTDNYSWLKNIMAAAVALQAKEADWIARHLASAEHAVVAASGHPRNGPRSEPNPVVANVEQFLVPMGKGSSKWKGSEEWQQVAYILEREAVSFDVTPGQRANATFSWDATPGESIEFVVDTEERHPHYGSGLYFTLTIPLKLNPDHVARLAIELGEHERTDWKRFQMLGSWCNHDGKLGFRAFLPNTVYRPFQLYEMTVTMATRAVWVNEYFFQMRLAAKTLGMTSPAKPAHSA